MQLLDAHCHLDFPEFDGRRAEVWQRARDAGVTGLVIPGVRQRDWGRVQQVAAESCDWWYCLGIHPWYIDEHDSEALGALEATLRQADGRCVAVGECGLDRLRGDLKAQQPWFEAQVELADRLDLSLVIHSVRTHDEVAAVLRRLRPKVPVLIHGFAGSYEQGRAFVELGCYLGVGGVITHDRARKTRDTVSRLPIESLVLETDAPDMSPAGVGKGLNEPATLRQILTTLAELTDHDEGALSAQLRANAGRLYRLPEPGSAQ